MMDGSRAGYSMNVSQGKNLEFWLPCLVSEWRKIRTGAKHKSGAPESLSMFRKPGGTQDSRPLSQAEIKDLGTSLLTLQRGLTGERKLAGTHYMEDSLLLGAYLMYYWPVSYIQTCMIFMELAPRSCKNSRILDLGCGPGPVSAAFMDAGATSVTLVDSSRAALDLAGKLLGNFPAPSGIPSVITGTSSIHIKTCHADLLAGEPIPPGPYDYIVASHLVNELWNDAPDPVSSRLSFLDSISGHLAPGGILLVTEPATRESSRNLLALRDRFLAGHPGFGIAAPCPQASPCPVLAAGTHRSCHAEYGWKAPDAVSALANSAGLERNSVKSAWIAFQHPGTGKPEHARSGSPAGSCGGNRPDSETGMYGSDSCDIAGRIVSEPMLNKAGKIRYLVCQGYRIVTVSAKALDPDAESAGFFTLTRGDSVSFKALAPANRSSGSEDPAQDCTQGFRFDANSGLTILKKAPGAHCGEDTTGNLQDLTGHQGFKTGPEKIQKARQQGKARPDTKNWSTSWTGITSKPRSGQQSDLNSRAPAGREGRMSTKSTHGQLPGSASRTSRGSPSGKKNRH